MEHFSYFLYSWKNMKNHRSAFIAIFLFQSFALFKKRRRRHKIGCAHLTHFTHPPFLPSHFLDLAEVFNWETQSSTEAENTQRDNEVFVCRDHRGTACRFTEERRNYCLILKPTRASDVLSWCPCWVMGSPQTSPNPRSQMLVPENNNAEIRLDGGDHMS